MRSIRDDGGGMPFMLLALLLLAGPAHGQTLVNGTVRDSLTGQPFSGAYVDLVPTAAPWTAGYSTRADSAGRFVFEDVSAGTYHFGFRHTRLDSLGMDPVFRTLDVRSSRSRMTADLALPTARTFARTLCRARSDNSGLLLGRVIDARDGSPIRRGIVQVRWGELSLGADGVRNDQAQRTATVRDDGRFIACGVPTDGPIEVQAIAGSPTDPTWVQPRTTSGIVELAFDYDTPLRHRDLYVAAEERETVAHATEARNATSARTSVRLGDGRLTGRVLDEADRPVSGARIVVREAGAESVSDSAGRFGISGLPLGTHTVEMIGLGLVPMRMAADLRSASVETITFRASKRVATLDEVTVRDRLDQSGFHKRRKQGNGFFLDAADIDRRSVLTLPMVLSSAPMLRIDGVSRTGQPVITGRGRCTPTVYVDGHVMAVGLDQALGATVLRDVGGIEVYANAAETPPQFSANKRIFLGAEGRDMGAPNLNSMCATIVIWTKAFVR